MTSLLPRRTIAGSWRTQETVRSNDRSLWLGSSSQQLSHSQTMILKALTSEAALSFAALPLILRQ